MSCTVNVTMSFRGGSKGDTGDNVLKAFQMAPSKAKILLRVKRGWFIGPIRIPDWEEITGENRRERRVESEREEAER